MTFLLNGRVISKNLVQNPNNKPTWLMDTAQINLPLMSYKSRNPLTDLTGICVKL